MADVYLAARYSRHQEMQGYADELRRHGHVVTSRWIAGNHNMTDEMLNSRFAAGLAARYAQEDIDDLLRATYCIFFTEEPRTSPSRGGRHVEFGIAIMEAKHLWIVGPRENVFHCLLDVRQFDRWGQALDCLNQLAPAEVSP
jgi:hypothetical protein